jgi:hypothetical protein
MNPVTVVKIETQILTKGKGVSVRKGLEEAGV